MGVCACVCVCVCVRVCVVCVCVCVRVCVCVCVEKGLVRAANSHLAAQENSRLLWTRVH